MSSLFLVRGGKLSPLIFFFVAELGRADLLPEQLERCFVVVDRDDDGRVTKEDFIKYVPHLYDVRAKTTSLQF